MQCGCPAPFSHRHFDEPISKNREQKRHASNDELKRQIALAKIGSAKKRKEWPVPQIPGIRDEADRHHRPRGQYPCDGVTRIGKPADDDKGGAEYRPRHAVRWKDRIRVEVVGSVSDGGKASNREQLDGPTSPPLHHHDKEWSRAAEDKFPATRGHQIKRKVSGTYRESYRSEEHTSELQSLRHL